MDQRRASQRLPMHLPVEIRWKTRAGNSKQAVAKTGNISGSGLYIELPFRLHRATSLQITVRFPRDESQISMELLCQGRVVRWTQRGQVQGVGAVIDQYELRPAAQRGLGKEPFPEPN